jgi:hypothetical protein
MKAIRYIATILLLAAGVGHISLFIQEPMAEVSAAAVLAFGIIYFVVAILLFLKIKYSSISGIIFPLIGIVVGLMAFDPSKGPLLLKFLGIMDVGVIILCSILEWNGRRKAR